MHSNRARKKESFSTRTGVASLFTTSHHYDTCSKCTLDHSWLARSSASNTKNSISPGHAAGCSTVLCSLKKGHLVLHVLLLNSTVFSVVTSRLAHTHLSHTTKHTQNSSISYIQQCIRKKQNDIRINSQGRVCSFFKIFSRKRPSRLVVPAGTAETSRKYPCSDDPACWHTEIYCSGCDVGGRNYGSVSPKIVRNRNMLVMRSHIFVHVFSVMYNGWGQFLKINEVAVSSGTNSTRIQAAVQYGGRAETLFWFWSDTRFEPERCAKTACLQVSIAERGST